MALFLTYFRADHIGLVWDFVEQGVPVYMGRIDYDYCKMLRSDRQKAMELLFTEKGFPKERLAIQNTGHQGCCYAPRPVFRWSRWKTV